jgi:HNH endonuclease
LIKPLVTAERLRKLLDYAPETGLFYWKVSVGSISAGRQAARRTSGRGYTVIRLDGRLYYAHRLAWLHVHGYHPRVIDHINGDKHDNRFVNLRDCSPGENARNFPSRAASGLKGVYRRGARWFSCITAEGRIHRLGTFATKREAAAAYDDACRRLHGAFGRPNGTAAAPAAASRLLPPRQPRRSRLQRKMASDRGLLKSNFTG